MQTRLSIDEDAMARAPVHGLRVRGVDVTTVLEAGMIGQSDAAQLEYATAQDRVIYTFNVGHFCQLHTEYLAAGKTHAGLIVVYRQRYPVGEQMRKLLQLVDTQAAEKMRNRLHFALKHQRLFRMVLKSR